jgi:hypothetical protein
MLEEISEENENATYLGDEIMQKIQYYQYMIDTKLKVKLSSVLDEKDGVTEKMAA